MDGAGTRRWVVPAPGRHIPLAPGTCVLWGGVQLDKCQMGLSNAQKQV
jgi:hypothetical protein